MILQGVKCGYAFSRNPILIRENYPPEVFGRNGGTFSINLGGETIYNGRFSPPLSIDISEILDCNVPFFPEPPDNSSEPIIEIEDTGELSDRTYTVVAQYESFESEAEVTAIPGGISKQNYRKLLLSGTDAFTTRFLNPKNNFFLTTRTAGWRIVLKETELYPLYFIVNKSDRRITIVEDITHTQISFDLNSKGVYALNMDAVRLQFLTESFVLANVFDIFTESGYACRIIISRSEISRVRYRLKFRNSLGVFEIIELTGELSVYPDYSECEDATFKRYDSNTGDFHTERERVERKQSVSVETGIKRPDEVRFLMDMIGSEEVYLLDLTPSPLKVIPTVEDFAYKPRPVIPEKFTLKLEIADSETNIMQDIIDGSESSKSRIFSSQFSNQFD